MAIIQFENGKKVQFDGTPTEKDIEEVAQKLGISKKKSLARKVGDFFTSSSQKFGQTLGTAASVVDPKTKKMREETLASSQKMADDYISRAKQEPDKEKAKMYLEAAKKISDTDDLDIFSRPEYQKTAKQIFGEGLGTFLEVASFSSFGGAGKSFQLGKASVPTIVKPLTKSGSILQGAKQGAAIGGAFGGAFGVSEAMMNDKSIGGIVQEGLISGAGGALLGGALGGGTTAAFQGISGLLSRASKLSQNGKALLSKAVTQKLEQTSRDLVKMSPTATKNETKWNKNTPNFIANEFVIDEKTLKPKSILQLIDSDGKRIDTTEAINALRGKYREESRAFNSLIKDSGEYASFNQLRDKTIRTIGDDYKTKGSDYEDALKYINKEIDAYKRNYRQAGLIEGDDVLIPISEMSRIKSGLWDKTSNFNPSQADKLLSDLNYRMGQTAKDLIEESVEDVAVKRMNQRLGDFASAIKVLDNAQGKVLPGGFFGRQFTRLAGTVAGSPGGVGGSIVGNITGGVLADIMVDPKIKTAIWTKLYQSLNKTVKGKSIIDEAIEILKKRGQERASRKLLEAPKFIPLGAKKDNSRLFTQDEANALLESMKIKEPVIKPLPKGKGEILKSTPKIPETVKVWVKSKFSDSGSYAEFPVIRKVDNKTLYQGSKTGESRQFWTPDKKYAQQFGDVKEKTGSFYQVDNGNRMTDVFVEVKPKSTPQSNLIKEAQKYKSADDFVRAKAGLATDTQYTQKKEILDFLKESKTFDDWDEISDALNSVGIRETNIEKAQSILSKQVAEHERLLTEQKRLTDIWNKANKTPLKSTPKTLEKSINEFSKKNPGEKPLNFKRVLKTYVNNKYVNELKNNIDSGFSNSNKGSLYYLLNNKDVFKKYPKLKDFDVVFSSKVKGGGSANVEKGVIYIDPAYLKGYIDGFPNILKHEVQHAKDFFDLGKTMGGSPSMFLNDFKAMRFAFNDIRNRAMDYKGLVTVQELKELNYAISQMEKGYRPAKYLIDKYIEPESYKLYLRLWGENNARLKSLDVRKKVPDKLLIKDLDNR